MLRAEILSILLRYRNNSLTTADLQRSTPSLLHKLRRIVREKGDDYEMGSVVRISGLAYRNPDWAHVISEPLDANGFVGLKLAHWNCFKKCWSEWRNCEIQYHHIVDLTILPPQIAPPNPPQAVSLAFGLVPCKNLD
jgi:hypothetical protein